MAQESESDICVLWREYNELFIELRELADIMNSTERAHRVQDEIYRKFITDLVAGRFRTDVMQNAMALLMKLNVVNYDVPGHWWYA
jgi:hypothetical protein